MKLIRDLTPDRYMACGIGMCPGLFETDDGRFVLIGDRLSEGVLPEGRVAQHEEAVVIPRDIAEQLARALKSE